MTFFMDWELWAKMCFVLGCLIFVVLLYGTGVQIRNRQKTKKLLRTGGLQRQRRNPDPEAGEIPFGVRALESGIQIEGVWHSKPNTPIPSNVGTPDVSRPASPVSSTNVPSPAQSNNQSSSDLRVQNSANEPVQNMAQAGNQRAFLRSHHANTLPQHSATFAPGTENEPRPSADITSGDYYPQNDRFRRFRPSIERAHTDPADDCPLADENHGDLQSLYSHRRYHAAEIGQLGTARGAGTSRGPNSRTTSQQLNREPWPPEAR